ncbi:MAG: cyclic nucleotide-binding domain-containing protein [Deltaproteobacteria bacterium]|nr:MAG: cyclic nucleotide-binding domain-containing protein [Deltaproteobacteria bacterium]
MDSTLTPVQRHELHAPRGTVIFRQGDLGDSMFVIERGRVRIVFSFEGHAAEVAVLEPGAFFGELSLLGGAARTASAEVIEDADLLVIRRDTFVMMMQDDIDIVFRMLSDMGVRLARTDERFLALILRVRRIRILGGCLRRISAGGETPAVLDVERLAEELQVAPPEVHATLAELAAQGAGTLRDGQFVIQDREHVTRLTEALCRLAEEVTD